MSNSTGKSDTRLGAILGGSVGERLGGEKGRKAGEALGLGIEEAMRSYLER